MLKIGITGGIGSGKSTVCLFFKQLGVPVYSADEKAKKLIDINRNLQNSIIREFGKEAFSDGKYNRSYIANLVFRDPSQLKKLNQLIHPAVTNDFNSWVKKHSDKVYILHEAAILFESDTAKYMDKSILVDAPEDLRIQRIINRDKTDRASVLKRMKNQWPTDKIRPMADWVIQNDQKTLVLPQVLRIHEQLIKY